MTLSITLPELALVAVLSAEEGVGLRAHPFFQYFEAGEVLRLSDFVRLVSLGPPTTASRLTPHIPEDAAWQALLAVAGQRLRCGLLTVIDAPLLMKPRRAEVARLAREHDVEAVLVALEGPEVSRQRHQLSRLLGPVGPIPSHLLKEGFAALWRVADTDLHVIRRPFSSELPGLTIPGLTVSGLLGVDYIGDVHGCLDELQELLHLLGYQWDCQLDAQGAYHPQGRTLAFAGDLTDRGPNSAGVLRLVMGLVEAGVAVCVAGNHDDRLLRSLRGRAVSREHGLEATLEQLAQQGAAFGERVVAFLAGLPPYLLLESIESGAVVLAHAGLPEYYQGRMSKRVRQFTLYGDVGGLDTDGLPIRRNWASKYSGAARVVYGHTPVTQAVWVNGTINIDTGCAFGGKLTALRLPENELVSVAAHAQYAQPNRPFITIPL